MLAAYLLLAQIGPGPPIGTSVISGQVRTTTGTPVAGIRVTAQYFPESLMIRGFRPRAEAQTDAAGRYRLQYLLAGRYTIAVGQS
jgi:protocatechuate 3,4-dioxygenase beta subunit